jgi:short-chain fatty acids transporter
MNASDKFIKIFKSILPAPFTIAVGLTAITFWIAVFFGKTSQSTLTHAINVLEYWENGLWNKGLMVFALQMMLMLVLGHVLALTQPVNSLINKAVKYCNNTANAAALVTLLTVIVSLFNWGLGLIFGAIFARKVGEHASANNIKLNYPLIGAAGYSGLMVWHGGLSGSAPIKVAEPGHFLETQTGVISQGETIFSSMNIIVSLTIILVLPLAMFLIGKKSKSEVPQINNNPQEDKTQIEPPREGAEKLDHSKLIAYLFGFIILGLSTYKAFIKPDIVSLKIITPNFINFVLLGLAIILHGNFSKFLKAIDSAIGGASGILIQFPLYFGIMGIMKDSGLVIMLSNFFVQISNETTFPIFTLFSAGLVNIFVPSGGGQWAVQGPIIVDAANQLGVSIPKSIMALAYGDQLTNMLQPFWALPLLGITGLRAKEILPYTVYLMLIGGTIYIAALLLF